MEELPTLRLRALEILSTASVAEKARLTREHVLWWRSLGSEEKLLVGPADAGIETPEVAAREVAEVPRGREKKAGAKGLVHALAHAEGCAVDCFWDLVARFGHEVAATLPGDEAVEFGDDVASIALDEATHFERLSARLEALGLAYGDLPATDTLAASMRDTKDDCVARLAVVHLVHEARGLDVFAAGRARLDRAGDPASSAVLALNYEDEVRHVRLMKRWFERLVLAKTKKKKTTTTTTESPRAWFHAIVRDPNRWASQKLKGPFNHEARQRALMDPSWYVPLAEGLKSVVVALPVTPPVPAEAVLPPVVTTRRVVAPLAAHRVRGGRRGAGIGTAVAAPTTSPRRRVAVHFALTYAAYCLVYLERKPVSVVKPMLASELGLSNAALATVDTAWLALYAVGQLSLGAARTVLSPSALLATGFILSGAFTAACSRAQSAATLSAFWGLNGLFQACANPLLVLHVADLFPPAARASAVGFWQTSQQVGGVLANLFAARTLGSDGWRAIFARAGTLVMAAAIPLAILVRSSPAVSRIVDEPPPPMMGAAAPARRPASLAGVGAVAAAYCLVKTTRYCLMFWLPFFLVKAVGVDPRNAANLASLLDLGGAIGTACVGLVADDLFRGAMLKACLPFAAATSLLLLVFAAVARFGGPLATAACMLAVGFCVAAPDGVLGGAAARNLCDYNGLTSRSASNAAPAVSGLINGCGSVGAILQGLGTAALVDLFGWTALFISLAAAMALATLFLLPAVALERNYLLVLEPAP
ncbi:hypothetical protein CTAYLR_006317 [Chrysophaeum taylorii]|uniref:Major facilitator superfamily (MFS) profile domain-containing protein n=1 Tax=Chrysophaeum taylorii TaxID=2483200 RepID=A0AAD7XJZ1_9STRA|nr:hypothetical protein CTAYLR_006317 [Chrysophaeum taylorii]